MSIALGRGDSIDIRIAENGYVLTYDDKKSEDKDGWCRKNITVLCDGHDSLLTALTKILTREG